MIRILNINDGGVGERVDWSFGSPLGNPFPKSKYGRAGCIARYRIWLWEKLQDSDSEQCAELERLSQLYVSQGKRLDLVCWCAPKACHAEVVARAIRWWLLNK